MSKVLVAYFSASGVTSRLANKLAKAVDGDTFEIKPAVAYTREDLNWNNPSSRSSIEMNNTSSRPKIIGAVENMDEYEILYIGFPIWWYTAPKIINTFLEQYDLSGKIIIPFATSGSSSIGSSAEDLKPSCPGATVKSGKRFPASTGETELKNWADNL